MINNILSDLNWVDILMGCIILRCIYMGARKGLVAEFFQLIGAFFATFIILHYYIKFANFLHYALSTPADFNELVGFILLWLIVFVIFKIVCEGWMFILKGEPHTLINKWGGVLLAIPRAALVCSLTFVLLFIANNKLLVKMSRSSLTGYYLIPLSAYVYETAYEKMVVKVFPAEEKNEKVLKLIKGEDKKQP